MMKTFSKLARTLVVPVMVLASVTSTVHASGPSFSDYFPSQSRATYNSSDPATNYWALLIGINDYAGSTKDNIGSYQDAYNLRKYLFSLHWHADHVVLLGNSKATASMVIQSIRWLASKTNSSSTVVFYYAGHERPGHTTADGDSESMDVGLWASDNKTIWDGTIGKELGKVRAHHMWIGISSCRAGGFDDSGMVKSGRILTYSSPQSELSYEDPQTHATVFGWYMINSAMQTGAGDTNGDGVVSVEEAYKYARPQVVERTRGKQHPEIIDKVSGSMSLVAPVPPPPASPPPQRTCAVVICH